jgi:hypothetical protein
MKVEKSRLRWKRTVSNKIFTEASMSEFLRHEFFMQFQEQPHLDIPQIIHSRMERSADADISNAA